ncbi:MAG: ATP-binding protein [Bacilli bacterium]|nr:ATP-binding protein [Bacilli bacterium]
MLIEFSIENFLSFKEKTTFSMIASSDKELQNNFIKINNERILKTTAIYGANASGKTNLFKIISQISSMIINSNMHDPNTKLPIIPFKLNDENVKKPSSFEIKFLIKEIKYVYGFKADKINIYEEYLIYYPNNRPVKIFTRTNIDEYIFNINDNKILNDIKRKNTNNKFFLSTATTWNYDKTKPVYDFLVNQMGVVLSVEQLNNYSYNMYFNDIDKSLERFALKFLKKADFNIEGYQMIEEKISDQDLNRLHSIVKTFIPEDAVMFITSTKHIVNGKEYFLDIEEESLGTKAIFSFIPVIKDVLDNGKIILIDEFDKSLHPFIVKYLVEIFNDKEINKNNSQLIFNTHDTNLLDLNLFRRDQIWFTEKNPETGESDLYPLDDFKVRKDENIEKGYLLGRYGGVPFLTNDFSNFND